MSSLQNIQDFINQSESILAGNSLDEQSTRTKIINRFIQSLGWDIYKDEVELEYSIQMMASVSKKVDYALKINGEPKVFIEAKGSDSDISENNIGQLKDYVQKEWIKFGLITNGRRFVGVKMDDSESGPPEMITLGDLQLTELQNNEWFVKLFSRSTIEREEADTIAEKLINRRKAVEHLRSNLEAISSEVTEVITHDLYEDLSEDVNLLAKDFINKVILEIESTKPTPASDASSETIELSDFDLVRPTDEAERTIERNRIPGDPDDQVIVVPANLNRGLDFLFRNNAWGFIEVASNPNYIAFYISGGDGASAVWYIGEVDRVTSIDDADLVDDPDDLIDRDDPKNRNKKVIEIKSNTIAEFDTPIPYWKKYPQSARYTELKNIREAVTTDDLF
jgi:predicted type IV restriction endonuclease